MGKSIRSKTKRAYRHKKREDSDFAVNEAARLARLSAKLAAVAGVQAKAHGEEPAMGEGAEGAPDGAIGDEAGMCSAIAVHISSECLMIYHSHPLVSGAPALNRTLILLPSRQIPMLSWMSTPRQKARPPHTARGIHDESSGASPRAWCRGPNPRA
jgi:hypothetical protein